MPPADAYSTHAIRIRRGFSVALSVLSIAIAAPALAMHIADPSILLGDTTGMDRGEIRLFQLGPLAIVPAVGALVVATWRGTPRSPARRATVALAIFSIVLSAAWILYPLITLLLSLVMLATRLSPPLGA